MTDCKHFWIIEEPAGPISEGECKYCHEKKRFVNSFPTLPVTATQKRKLNKAINKMLEADVI